MKIDRSGLIQLLDVVRTNAYIVRDNIDRNETRDILECSQNIIDFVEDVKEHWEIYEDEDKL